MTFNIKLPKPYATWQRHLITEKTRLMCLALGTKCGKTLGGAGRIANFSFKAPLEQAALYRIIAPTYQQASITFKYLDRLFPSTLPPQNGLDPRQYRLAQEQWAKITPERSESRMKMKWNHNQAMIQCIHAQDPERSIEGERTHGNLIDEAAKVSSQAFASVMSTTSQTGGWIACTSTPRGKNWFYDLYRQCQEHMAWAEKHQKPYEQFCATARTIDSPYVDKRVVEQARLSLPDRLFRQLYLAEFLDDGSVFAGHRDCVEGPLIESYGKIQAWQTDDAKSKKVVIGADWAKRTDYGVFVAFEVGVSRPRLIGFRRFQGLDYKIAIRELYQFTEQFDEVLMVRHDRTGIGDVINDLLSNFTCPVDPVVFTNESKSSMVDSYMVAIETRNLIFPNWPELIKEHDNYDVKMSVLGKPTYSAPSGLHDDIVTACFLAWSAVLETQDRIYDVRFLEDLPKTALSIENWYSDLADEHDDF